jgi:hypothetical protein
MEITDNKPFLWVEKWAPESVEDLILTKSVKEFFTDWPTAVVASKDKRHAIVGTRDGHLVSIILNENIVRFDIKLKDMAISNLHIDFDYLYVSYVDGLMELFELNSGEESVIDLIAKEKYDEAMNIIKNIKIILDKL